MADTPIYDNPWVQGGAAGLGASADIYAFIENFRRQQALKKIYDILSNPAKLSAYIASFNTPMSAQAIQATNRDLGANWATQTGGAPGGAMNQFTADAFAKIENQRQQTAAEQAIRALTGASGTATASPTSPLGNLGAIMSVLQKLRGSQGTPTRPTAPAPTTPYPLPVPDDVQVP